MASDAARDNVGRLQRCFVLAFARSPTEDESRKCMAFLGRAGWADLCHALINMKEFIFID
jgi:hypothetical protein